MNLKTWLKGIKRRKTNIEDGVLIAYDIKGGALGEVEYKDGKLIRRETYRKGK